MKLFKTILFSLSLAILPVSIGFAADAGAEQQPVVKKGAPAGQQAPGLGLYAQLGLAAGATAVVAGAVALAGNEGGGEGATATTGTTP